MNITTIEIVHTPAGGHKDLLEAFVLWLTEHRYRFNVVYASESSYHGDMLLVQCSRSNHECYDLYSKGLLMAEKIGACNFEIRAVADRHVRGAIKENLVFDQPDGVAPVARYQAWVMNNMRTGKPLGW